MNFGSLHTRSHFSFLRGASSPEELVLEAYRLGHRFLCVTDWMGVYSAVRLQKACLEAGLQPIIGAEVTVDGWPLVLIARDAQGYANLCYMITIAHQRSRDAPSLSMDEVRGRRAQVLCLTGGRDGRLWNHMHARHEGAAREWLAALRSTFGNDLYVELVHHRRPRDGAVAVAMHRLATEMGIACVIGGDVRHATSQDYAIYDMCTCIRKGITIFDADNERPVNDEHCLKSAEALQALLPFPDAFATTTQIAAMCSMDILPGHVTPPPARVPEGYTAAAYLDELCTLAFDVRYGSAQEAPDQHILLRKELGIIEDLDLPDFFLVVREVVYEARQRGIRCSGRGSAANSIVSYLLGITGVDPVKHRLMFERFLHHGRVGTPDIDVDFDSDLREQVIAWMEERFGIEHTAMTANVITYRLRMAVRDVAKALGWPLDIVNMMSKAMPGHSDRPIVEFKPALAAVVGDSPLVDTLLHMVERMLGRPRHLGLHSGGMILSARPLHTLTPVQISANAVKVAQFDKDDIEAMGLVKLDVLGLRMLSCISETLEMIRRHEGTAPEIDELDLADPVVYDMIRSGHTLAVFQIESQGQMHLLAQHQPEVFGDLVTEVALFRPGPLQGGTLTPYVRRRRGKEPVSYLHPLLEPILRDTYGIIVFQEQVLEIAHAVGDMSLRDAEEFRSIISRNRDASAIARMKARLVEGALRLNIDAPTAQRICDQLAHFTGYGFCRSHAAAFAKTVYQSAWLKRYHPAAYMAAFMEHRPGFYNLMTLEEEARRLGVNMLLPDINASFLRYDLERRGEALAIRKPLTSIAECTADVARTILWARLLGPFTSTEDFVRRVDIPQPAMEAIALSGALDTVSGDSRKALWEVGVAMRRKQARQDTTLFDLPLVMAEDIPPLPPIRAQERLAYDYLTHKAARIHPMTLYRRTLNELEVRSIGTCYRVNDTHITTAGIVILRQSPPTAKGFLFITLEDETGFIQCVVNPVTRQRFSHELRHASLIVRGRVQGMVNWRGIVVDDVRIMTGVSGGYHGHLSMYGGRDRMEVEAGSDRP